MPLPKITDEKMARDIKEYFKDCTLDENLDKVIEGEYPLYLLDEYADQMFSAAEVLNYINSGKLDELKEQCRLSLIRKDLIKRYVEMTNELYRRKAEQSP